MTAQTLLKLCGCFAAVIFFAVRAEVRVTVTDLPLPTYKMGPDEKNPLFRGFQLPGTRAFRGDRTIYPYPKADYFSFDRQIVHYKAITLENEFIQIVIIPDLRGRVQGAIDKRNGWDFLYYNHVIKPGDISVRGGWIAGGLEWNHPGGHGYTQFTRISHKILDNPDGSKTVLVAEIEPARMMKWETAITLRPGTLAVETEGRFYSTAPYPVPFASSLNGAMHATEETEAIYPEGSWITGHGKTYVQPWPVYDGVDHRWFKNLTSSYSIFTENSIADFYGCYSHDKNAGTAIYTDHRTAPGKKYFSWGAHPGGRRWDTLLSDTDGPYIELQVGAFWDNLGYGYAWLNPMETKSYTVFWYPLKDLGGFVKATGDAVLNLKEAGDGKIRLGVQVIRSSPGTTIAVSGSGSIVYRKTFELDPSRPVLDEFRLPPGVKYEDLCVRIEGPGGRELLSYSARVMRAPKPTLPKAHKPLDKASLDELYMWGKGFYQDPFGSEAEAHYREILRREPADSRANREMGLIALHRGQWEAARERLERSLENDPLNDGFYSHHYLGLAALGAGSLDRAREEFIAASRYGPLKAASVYYLAEMACRQGDYRKAAALLTELIEEGAKHPRIWSMLAFVQRRLGDRQAAGRALDEALRRDPLEFVALLEKWFRDELPENEIHEQFDRRDPSFVGSQLYIEGSLSYGAAGAWDDAAKLLQAGRRHFESRGKVPAMLDYYLGYSYEQLRQPERALECYRQAAQRDSTYVFPYQPPDIEVLRAAIARNPEDGRAWQYLGSALFYLNRYEEANLAWERSLEVHPANAIAMRNLALGSWAVEKNLDRTISLLDQASAIDPADSRLLLELDHFLNVAGKISRRAELLAEREQTVMQRDELVLSWSRLLLRLQEYEKAAALMEARRFFARESRADTHAVYAEANYGAGEKLLAAGKPAEALHRFEKALEYPENLGEGAPAGEIVTRGQYLAGAAYEAMGDAASAQRQFEEAAASAARLGTENAIYRALALRKLGKGESAGEVLQSVVAACEKQTMKGGQQAAAAYYVLSRAQTELGRRPEAKASLNEALQMDADAVLRSRIEGSRPAGAGQP